MAGLSIYADIDQERKKTMHEVVIGSHAGSHANLDGLNLQSSETDDADAEGEEEEEEEEEVLHERALRVT